MLKRICKKELYYIHKKKNTEPHSVCARSRRHLSGRESVCVCVCERERDVL